MTSTDDEILNAILEEEDEEPKIPHDIHDLTEKLNIFVTNNFLTQPLSHQQSLRIYYSASEKVSSMLCDLVHSLCQHLDLPDSIYKDFEYGFNTVINDIVKTNTKLTSSVLSDSQNNSPIGKLSNFKDSSLSPSPINLRNSNFGDDNDQQNEKDEIKALKEKIALLKNELKESNQTTEILEDTVTKMSHERKNLENIHSKELLELRIQVDQKEHDKNTLKDEIVILNNRIKSAEERIESFKRQFDELNASNDRMLENVQAANNKIVKKSQKISALKSQITNLTLKLKAIPTMDELSANSNQNDESGSFVSPYTPKEKLKAMKAEEAIKLLTEANMQREADILKKDKIIQKSFEIIQKELSLIHEYEYRTSIYDEEVDHNKRIIQSQTNANQKVKKIYEELKELLNEKENENKELKSQINNLKKQSDGNSNDTFNNSTRFVSSTSNLNMNQVYMSEDGEVRYGTIEEMKNEIDRLRGSVDILATFIEDLLNKEDRTAIPLLQSTSPIFQDEVLKNAILERIEQMKFAFNSYKKTPEIDFFFQVFKDNTRSDVMIKSYIESGRNDLYAYLVALSAVDKRLISFIRYQDTILESLNEYVPEGYENTEEAMISFVADSRRVYDYLMQIYEILRGKGNSKKKQGFAPLFDLLRQFKGMATMIDTTFRKEPFNFKETMNELPLFLQDYAIELQNQIAELQNMNMEKNEIIQELKQKQQRNAYVNISDTEYDELNAQIKRLSERIEGQVQKILSQKLSIETGQKTIDRLNSQIEDLTADKKECEINLNAFQIKCEELLKHNEKLSKEIEHLNKTLEVKNKIYQNRLDANLQSIQSKCDEEILMLKKRHEEQVTLLNNNLQKRISKVHSLKTRIEEMQTNFDETTLDQRAEIIKLKHYIEESDGKIQDMKTKIAALKKAQEIAQQAANKQSLMMSSFSPLQNVISFPISPTPNQDYLLSPSITENERTEVNFLATPVSSKSGNMSSITMSALSDKNDRFTSQIGRILSKYTNENRSACWTRTKVINTVTSLVDQVISLEKKINNSIIIDISAFNSEDNNDDVSEQQRKKNMAEVIKEGSLWQAWSNEIITLIGAKHGTPEVNRTFIRDFVVTTMSKCSLVFKLQLLRTQKRILLKNNSIISSYLVPGRYEKSNSHEAIDSIGPLILIVSLCFKLKKFSKSPVASRNTSRSGSGFTTPAKMRLNRISVSPQ